MKLEKIHLGGFKSFAEPTTIELKEKMTGIVGPNGCGKSNVVDAIRWVMGETPRHIRASSFDEVIFSGTANRKPMGQAFVELTFNNTEGTLQGEYAQYSELSLRRVVDRNRETKYYLNNKRCRRKDIADLFLGTGLGSNSYAIIEQGTVSHIIEAKPQEMWRYIEEAAGVSRYKERRRETSTRIRHTRDNLDRVMDLRDEVARQLQRLKRQSKDAERYGKLCENRDVLEGDLKWLRIKELDEACAKDNEVLAEKKRQLETNKEALRSAERALEEQRKQSSEKSGIDLAIKEKLHRMEVQINTLNEGIQRDEASIQLATSEKEKASQQLIQLAQEVEAEQGKLTGTDKRATELKIQHEQKLVRVQSLSKSIAVLQEELDGLNEIRNKHQSESQESSEIVKIEQARSKFFHKALDEIEQTFVEIKEQRERMDLSAVSVDAQDKRTRLEQQRTSEVDLNKELKVVSEQIQSLRGAVRELNETLHAKQEEVQSVQGKIASLEVLIEAQLGLDKESFQGWLKEAGLSGNHLLAEQLEVAEGWENAVETVLGAFLEGVRVKALSDKISFVSRFPKGRLVMVEGSDGAARPSSLGEKVSKASGMQEMLSHVYIAETTEEALRRRMQLGTGESVITKEGVWMGHHWLQTHRFAEDDEGMLTRKQRVETLKTQHQSLLSETAHLKHEAEQRSNTLTQYEQKRDEVQRAHSAVLSDIALLTAEVSRCEEKIQQINTQTASLAKAEEEATHRRAKLLAEREQSLQDHNKATAQVLQVAAQFGNVETMINEKGKILDEQKQHFEICQADTHKIELEQEAMRGTYGMGQKNIDQLQIRDKSLREKNVKQTQILDDLFAPLEGKKEKLKQAMGEQAQVLEQQTMAGEKTQGEQQKISKCTEERNKLSNAFEALRASADEINTRIQVNQARREDVRAEFNMLKLDENEIAVRLAEGADQQVLETTLQEVKQKINRLGAVNLVALEELQEEEERKQYIDGQHNDLSQALTTLEEAIKKIDHETQTRFKDTFDRINTNLKEIFPALFSGGEAYLRMIDLEEEQGITVMVKPPGKRLSSIQLMSGGEKALAAAAVIFSIFKLNPAPFCVLDEVDAPLDEHNVKVFCEMIRTMQDKVQFIMITHNKASMEYMDALLGVTMHELGVSRVVSVDVEKVLETNAT
ncbi:MAG: chromosome segregation protein SMC [Candidatus Oxydemutatoraceae bacterium WSBS_2016_MAG_OTU14]